jgi:multidrug efflux pump subunit AcrB
MWIVRLALRRPYTTVCMAMLMLLVGAYAAFTMATDIFPAINLPVVSVIWSYGGLPAKDMEGRMVTIAERSYSIGVSDIEHMESESLDGIAVIRIYLQPNASVDGALSQITATSQAALRQMPQGTTPPYIIRFNATDVPVMEIGISSATASGEELNDAGNNFVRPQLVNAQGSNIAPVFGGAPKAIQVDLDLARLYALNMSPADVSNAINAQNVILPAGTARMGDKEYHVRLDASPAVADRLNDLPIRSVNGQMVYIKDVAHVRLGAGVQTNVVRVNGRRGAYIEVLKTGKASTLSVVANVKKLLVQAQAAVPGDIQLAVISDQSTYVRSAINGVLREGLIAACLTAIMILLFLGSLRSTAIVALSIPLSIMTSVICLAALGQTINIMTLGGLALAVGILVDDATVEVENIHRNLAMGKELLQAILDGASQIAVPAFVSSVSICIVFVPIFFLSGPAASLFRPLAMAVIFAVLASYLLSRTLVPTMALHLLEKEKDLHQGEDSEEKRLKAGWNWKLNVHVERGFDRFRNGYHSTVRGAVEHRTPVLLIALGFVIVSAIFVPFIGQDFFPSVDAGQLRLHVRTAPGTRIEQTELIFGAIERAIRRVIPESDTELMLDNIGLAGGGLSLATGDQATIGAADGEILVALKDKRKGKTGDYQMALRDTLAVEFPNQEFFFQPADIVTRILNLGLPSPIDVQLSGRQSDSNFAIATKIADQVRHTPGAADVRVQQVVNAPEMFFSIDRSRAEQSGLTTRDVASSLLISLSSSFQSAPNFWLDPKTGVNYQVAVQTPIYKMGTMEALATTPVSAAGRASTPELLSNLVSEQRQVTPVVVTHYNILPSVDVFASADGRDLGGVAKDIEKITKKLKLPKGSTLTMRGQVKSMRESFKGLLLGICAALLLVYILLVINFQSWIDPLIIVMALPGALSGVMWGLFVTHTTFSVPSLMGTIMAMGVATSNSVLLITFADDERKEGKSAEEAAISAGVTRLRPVIMTALAMIIGMLPMAFAMGEGGEQNAPLGRAVIGGLIVASLYTLLVVPTIYTWLRKEAPAEELELPEPETAKKKPQRAPSTQPAPAHG